MNIAQQCAGVDAYAANARADAQFAGDSAVGGRQFMPKILFVDDEPQVVEAIRRALHDYSYRINTATSPEVALHMSRHEQFDVIIADELMPGMRGSELLTIIGREFPTSGRILLTGHATVEAAARAINEAGVIRLLLKPCPPRELRAAIELALRTTPFEHRTRAGAKPGTVPRRRTHAAIRARLSARAVTSRPAVGKTTSRPESPNLVRQGPIAAVKGDGGHPCLQAQRIFTTDGTKLTGIELSPGLRPHSRDSQTPRDFIASADHQIVWDALRVLAEHEQRIYCSDLTVSVNIGCQSLAVPEFADFLENTLSASQLVSRFMIEMRESSLIQRLRRDRGFPARLISMKCLGLGTRLCIDGVTGETEQLALLNDLPISMAKIDSRFIGDVLVNPQSEWRVRDIVEWGHRAGIEIAAAGVDTFAISERLHSLGVRYAQGGAFGTPQPLELFLRRLNLPLRQDPA